MKGQSYTINSEHTLKSCLKYISEQWHKKKWMQITFNYDKTRSLQQNSALHVYCRLLADAMNAAGYNYTITINGKETECDWDGEMVKRFMWKPIQKAITDKESSTEPSTKEYPQVYETLNRYTASKLGISIDWPIREKK